MTTHEMMDLMGSEASPAEAEEMIKLLGDRQHQDICWTAWKSMLDTATERVKRATSAPAKIEFPADLAHTIVMIARHPVTPNCDEFWTVAVLDPITCETLASSNETTYDEALAKVRAVVAAKAKVTA